MRLVPRGQSLHLHTPLFSRHQHPAPGTPSCFKSKPSEVLREQKAQLGFCHNFLSYSSFNPGFFFPVRQAQAYKAVLASTGEVGNVSFVGLRNVAAFIWGRGVSKLHFPRGEGSSPESQLFLEARQPCCLDQPEALAPHRVIIEMVVNFPWKENTPRMGTERRRQRVQRGRWFNASYT